MITGVALAATGVAAQTAPAPGSEPTKVQEFVVTGSRIPQPNLTGVSPVTSIGSNDLKLQGTGNIDNLLNTLPQITAAQGGNISNGATGTAQVNLRNLGPQRTLVLIDGKRLGPGDVVVPTADLNFIPSPLVKRVEIDTAGASSVYGADAVAGVVNFIMQRDFEGIQLDVNYGGYMNTNGNSVAQEANLRKGFTPPTGTWYGGQTVTASAIIGVNAPDGKGNVEGYITYTHTDPVTQNEFDYSNCQLTVDTGGALAGKRYSCGGSSITPDGRFFINNRPGSVTLDRKTSGTAPGTGMFRPRTGADVFNFNPYNYFQRPDERYTGGFFGKYDINKHVEAYADFMFMDDHTTAQIAPSGIFGTTYNISCTNPLLSGQQVQQICTDQGIDPKAPGAQNAVTVLKRNVEGGPRRDNLRHTDYRGVVGIKGPIDDNWSYDVYGLYWASVYSEDYQNDVSKRKVGNALNVATDTRTTVAGQPNPTFGTAQCQSFIDGTDTACVPYNIWVPGGVTPAQIAYVGAPGFKNGQTTQQIVEANVTGNLAPYGGKSPWAHDGVGVSLGADYRRDALVYNTDEEFLTGDLAGQGAVTPSVDGATTVKELYGEARVPIVQDMAYAKDVELELGYRFSHYSSVGDTNTYKIQGSWRVNDDVMFRGGFNQTVRAPNVQELYNPAHLALDGSTDPCASDPGKLPAFSAAQCANTGVSAAQYGKIVPNPANQYNGILGGNPNLKPETAHTYQIGAVITPVDLVRGMSFTMDYFHTSVNNFINSFGADTTLAQCVTTGLPTYCNLITRAPGSGSLWLGTNGFVTDISQNLQNITTSGIDFAYNYQMTFKQFGLPDYGGLGLQFIGTYTATYSIDGAPGTPTINCVSKFGTTCQGTTTPQTGPLPAFKGTTRLTWTTPVNGLNVSLNWRYIGPSDLDTGEQGFPQSTSHINAYNYFDVAGTWHFKDRYTVRVGINNMFDKDPPIIGSAQLPPIYGNGNTFPQVYDALGRYLFMGLTADF